MKHPLTTMLTMLATLLTANQTAFAETTTLVCTNDQRPSDRPFYYELDQNQSTVVINIPSPPIGPPSSSKFSAKFEPKEIAFFANGWAYSIDRLTGIVSARADQTVLHFTCHVGKAQF